MSQIYQRYQSLRNATGMISQETEDWETLVDSVLTQVVLSTVKQYQRKLNVGVQDSVSDLLDTFKQKITQTIFEVSDRWRAASRSDISLFPKNCRFCYSRGRSTIIVIEQDPLVRSLKFAEAMQGEVLGSRRRGEERVTLSLPYSIFFLHFVNGRFRHLYVGWRTRPLETLQDYVSRPLLPNIHDNLNVCLGGHLPMSEGDSISQQTDVVLNDFWSSEFNQDLADRSWWQKGHIDDRLRSGDMWANKSLEDPMFILSVEFRRVHTVQEMLNFVANAEEEPVDESHFRHRLAEEIDKHVESLFSKILKYFKKTKFEKHFPKGVQVELAKAISDSTKELVDVLYAVHVEVNKLAEDCRKERGIVQPQSVFWEEYSP